MAPITELAARVRLRGERMIGKRISHFEVLEKLGEGGMGVVYRAKDIELDRPVALKVLRRDSVGSEARRSRFLREGRAAAKASHPSIATIHEIGEEHGEIFIAMELVVGQPLSQVIGGRPLPIVQALEIGVQIAEGLAAAHRSHVIHRDLKPANVVLTDEGRVKILDFGLAKLLDPGGLGLPAHGETAEMVTQEGKILGTVAYMSPEQARGLEVDERSDLFSFGITLYEMATGRPPFRGETPSDTLAAILREEPHAPVIENPEVPPELSRIIARCLEKDPARRYPNAAALAGDLRSLLGSTASATVTSVFDRPAFNPRRPSTARKRIWAFAGIAVLAVAAVAVLWLPRWLGSGNPSPAQATEPSIAVLPLRNIKDPADPERLGQILQDLIINDLAGGGTLKVFTSQRLADVQRNMTGEPSWSFDEQLAMRVAKKAGATMVLEGSLSQLGDRWILACQLIDVASGNVVGSRRIDGSDLYTMVDQFTDELRAEDRLALAAPPATEPPTPPAPPAPSLSTYRAYLAANDLLNNARYAEAADTLARVIREDPSFGGAYYKRAIALWWDGHSPEAAKEVLEPLVNGQVKASPQERMMAEAARTLIDHDYERGSELYRRISERYPDEKEAWYGLGEALFHGEVATNQEAKAAFERAIDLDPSFTLAYQHLFDIATRQGDFASSLERVRSFVAAHPDNPTGYQWWIQLATGWGDETEIARALAEGRRHAAGPDDQQRVLIAGGNGYQARNDFIRARALYEEALAIRPELPDPAAYARLGSVYFHLREKEKGERLIAEFGRRFPDRGRDLDKAKVEILLATGEPQEALALARRVAQGGPTAGAESQVLIGRSLAANGRFEEMETLCDSVLGSSADLEEKLGLLRGLGMGLAGEGERDRGRALLERALSMDPMRDRPRRQLGLAWTLLGEGESAQEAAGIFRSMLETDPFEAKSGLAAVDLIEGRYEQAERNVREMLATGPRRASSYYLLGLTLEGQKKHKEALEAARKAAAMDDQYLSNALVAWILVDGDIDVQEGLRLAERVKQEVPLTPGERAWLLPMTASIEHTLGLASMKTGRPADAVRWLEEAQKLQPDRARIAEDLKKARALS